MSHFFEQLEKFFVRFVGGQNFPFIYFHPANQPVQSPQKPPHFPLIPLNKGIHIYMQIIGNNIELILAISNL